MMRPRSVALAEQLYLAATLLLVVLAAMGWSDLVSVYGVAGAIGANAFGIGLSLLLIILTTRRASRVALWLLVVWTAFSVCGYLYSVSLGVLARGLFGILTTIQAVLPVIAVVLLFRPNARAWFAEQRGHGDGELEA